MNPVTYLTTTEAAAILGVTPRILALWQQKDTPNRPRAEAIAGRNYLFTEKEIRAWKARQQA